MREESSWTNVWPSLHKSGSRSPNPTHRYGREELGRDTKCCPRYTSVFPVCSLQFLTSHAGAGVWQVSPCLYSASPPQLWICIVFLSFPCSLYLMFIFLCFYILFICLSFHLISPILKGLSGEERASPASPRFIYQIRPGVRFYLRKGE